MNLDSMKVKVLKETGYEEALLGISLSYEQDMGKGHIPEAVSYTHLTLPTTPYV